jgi:hypothetical protein
MRSFRAGSGLFQQAPPLRSQICDETNPSNGAVFGRAGAFEVRIVTVMLSFKYMKSIEIIKIVQKIVSFAVQLTGRFHERIFYDR